ncbi:ABC transporter ATP-binding protein [Marinicrinis sediminis]|uniref:ABC transporter ATP-binding protein n=1 Tax=Marinicrinis sediminis TaxID=1652465 RepID=A0ABW5RC41_9BACL
MVVVQVEHLKKTFGSITAVEDVSFEVQEGEIFTIIGPNGAGKTTTLEMIEGLQHPDSGSITVMDMNWKQDEAKIKQRIGVQPQTSALFDLLTVYENLLLFQSFYHQQRAVEEILELVNLTEHQTKKVKALSGGQKQRLAIGLAMINDSDILFLDEPTTGLDPQARRNIWDIILKLKEMNKTTILTTHYMEEAEKLSDRVCIVDQGKIIAMDTPAQLIQQLSKEREIVVRLEHKQTALEEEELLNHASGLPDVVRAEWDAGRLSLVSTNAEVTLFHLLKHTNEQEIGIEQISIREMSLEDVFIAFTGKEWRD